MSKIDVILDISNKNLSSFPLYILEMTNLKMLYLEGNEIEVLPEELFIKLKKLVWLDVRRNKLKTIPQTVAFHENLETLLVRDNDISMLPLELGLVPNLKVLQISGNPIIYPKIEILQEGVQAIVSYLKKQFESTKENYKVVENPVEPDIKCVFNQRELQNTQGDNIRVSKPAVKVKSYRKDSKCSLGHHKLTNRVARTISRGSSVYKDYHARPNKISNLKNNEQRVEEKFVKDLWMCKLKDILKYQDEELQRKKDGEMLKNWQQAVRHKQCKRPLNLSRDFPYDVNEDYMKLPSRKDLGKVESKTQRMCRIQPKVKIDNMDKYIGEIVDSLHHLGKEKINPSPHQQMEKAGKDIKKIIELQKRLSMLKLAIAKDVKI